MASKKPPFILSADLAERTKPVADNEPPPTPDAPSVPDAPDAPSVPAIPNAAGVTFHKDTEIMVHMTRSKESLKGLDVLTRRLPFIEKAVEFSTVHCGRDPKVAHAKWLRVLHGLKSPVALVDPELRLASFTNWCEANAGMLDPIQGWLKVPVDGDRTREYRVKLPDAKEGEPFDQHVFLLCVKRQGQVNVKTATDSMFWSHNLVILETEEVSPEAAGMAFVYALDPGLDKDGNLLYETANIYFIREDDLTRRSGRRVIANRADKVELPSNLLGYVTKCALQCGFPLAESRINRRTNQEQRDERMIAQIQAITARNAESGPSATVPEENGNGRELLPTGLSNPFRRA